MLDRPARGNSTHTRDKHSAVHVLASELSASAQHGYVEECVLAIDLECGLPPDRSFLLFPADESDGTSSILCGSLSCTCGFELVVDNIGRGGGGRLSLRHEAELLAMGLAMGDGTFCREHYAVSSQVSAVRRFSRREKNRFFEITEISVTTLEQTTIGQTSTISEPTLRFVALVHFVVVRFLFCGWPVSLSFLLIHGCVQKGAFPKRGIIVRYRTLLFLAHLSFLVSDSWSKHELVSPFW